MNNVVPFMPQDAFARLGIDWTRTATTEQERIVREAFLTEEASCGARGLASILLLALKVYRQGSIAEDLHGAAEFAETTLSIKLRQHQDDTLVAAQLYAEAHGPFWS